MSRFNSSYPLQSFLSSPIVNERRVGRRCFDESASTDPPPHAVENITAIACRWQHCQGIVHAMSMNTRRPRDGACVTSRYVICTVNPKTLTSRIFLALKRRCLPRYTRHRCELRHSISKPCKLSLYTTPRKPNRGPANDKTTDC